MITSRIVWAMIAIALVSPLSGCDAAASGRGNVGSSPSARAVTSAVPHVTAPLLGSLVASAEGLGPIKLEQPISAATASLGLVEFDAADCVGDLRGDSQGQTIAAKDPDAGGWEANYPGVHEPFGGAGPFSITTFTETNAGTPLNTRTSEVAEIGIWDKAIHTQAGVGIGSTLVQLTAAYPSIVHAIHGEESDVYVVSGLPGDIWVEIQGNDPAYWMNNNQGRVLWMTIVPHGSEPFAIAATSGGAYPCPVE